jgi:hypothetical protein
MEVDASSGTVVDEQERRRKHAELIKNLLVAINEDFKGRFGVPNASSSSSSASTNLKPESSLRSTTGLGDSPSYPSLTEPERSDGDRYSQMSRERERPGSPMRGIQVSVA